ncbi:MAG: CUAEP/CCAEP-tail radical SAM protein [Bryobacteraceae bacterium]
MRILLVSTYELGRQPFGLASAAAWLRARGHTVDCADLAVEVLPKAAVCEANVVAFFLPMHTATRLAARAIERVRALNPAARLGCFGLYAPLNEAYLRGLGVEIVVGGEFEQPLADTIERAAPATAVSTARQQFLVPDRTGLPPLADYARLHVNGSVKLAGYTEASRGCKHLCRHCPVVPVYNGRFRIVPPEVVIEDIRRQVAAGAGHISFGDPDFFNGPAHALRIVRAFAERYPDLTYDVTIKIEHLLKHRDLVPVLRETGCLFVTTAVESIEDEVLARLEKGHTRADFIEVARLCREAGLELAPTFIPFTPWTTWAGYRGLLRLLVDLDLVDRVAPVQLGLRLLVTAGSRLLELPEIAAAIGEFDQAALIYPWCHADASLDDLSAAVLRLVARERQSSRRDIFARIWQLATSDPLPENFDLLPRAAIPFLNEPWYC